MPRGGTPLGFVAPSLEASNQSQIDDLVQRSRTLEHAKQKLVEQLAHETTRSKEAIAELQKKWQHEKTEYNRACDILQSCHRAVQLRNLAALERERSNVLKEQDITRKEKLLRLQRDFKITMFQTREAELEDRVGNLEAERDALIDEVDQHTRKSKGQHVEHLALLKEKDHQLATAKKEKEELQVKLTKLRDDLTSAQNSTEELSRAHERATLQAESAATTRDELKRTNEELKRTNADMHLQLERWENLENKGGAEMELKRKRCGELELQVDSLQTQLEKTRNDHQALFEKEKRKVERLKDTVREWQAETERREKDIEDAQKQLAKAMKRIAKLTEALEAERSKKLASPTIPAEISSDKHITPQSNRVALQPERIAPPDSPVPARPRPKPRPLKVASVELVTGEMGTKNRTIKESAKPLTPLIPVESDSEIEEVPAKVDSVSKNKGKSRARDQKGPETVVPEDQPNPIRRKRKATEVENSDGKGSGNDGLVIPATQKAKKAKRLGDEVRGTDAKARRTAQQSASAQLKSNPPGRPAEEDINSDAGGEPVAKKKRRKINIFPTNVPSTGFNFIPNVGDGGLNIPTALSPVKDSGNVPARSTTGSVIGSIGSLLRNSFATRR